MKTSERARALYLIVLHSDIDHEFQKAMLPALEPYAGKTLEQRFYKNLVRQVAFPR